MKRFHRARGIALATALTAFALATPVSVALADESSTTAGHMVAGQDHSQMQGMQGAHSMGAGPMHGAALRAPGQDAFGAIQEVVRALEADPNTDWTKVDLDALRQHLIDMNEVTLKADAAAKPVDGGLAIEVTGAGRTLGAIQRMLPAHAQELNRLNGWSARTEALPNGVRLTVTSSDAKEVAHIRGLGFIGLLVSGAHHQPHHLAMAKGAFAH